jgi:hypothetical protein
MTRKQFIAKVVNEALELKVTVKLVQQKSVSRLGGWFSGKELVCAMNNDCSFETLVHEYCHMLQWTKNCGAWRKHIGEYGMFTQWVKGEIQCNEQQLQQLIKGVITLEHDCEKRALRCIKQYNLDVDTDYYIACSNVYLYSFHKCIQDRKSVPVFTKSNLNLVPNKLLPLKYYIADSNKTGKKISCLLDVTS